MPQAAAGLHGGPRRARAPLGAPGGFVGIGATSAAGHPTAPLPPPMGEGVSIATHGPGRMLPYHPQSGVPSQVTWSVGHLSEVSGATVPKAYVPRMMD